MDDVVDFVAEDEDGEDDEQPADDRGPDEEEGDGDEADADVHKDLPCEAVVLGAGLSYEDPYGFAVVGVDGVKEKEFVFV